MKQTLSRLCLFSPTSWLSRMLFALCLCWSAGCTSVNMNPAYFPYFFPTPYANYDPDLVRIELQPIAERTLQVGTQHVLLVGVYDKNNITRRGRQVEFMVSGAGSIVDIAPTCGLWRNKPDQQYAITSTVCFEHKLSRGTGNVDDDILVKPGYAWCVLTSPVEGDTQATVYAPGIHNWDKRLVHTTIHWVDAAWEFPVPVQVRAGSTHVLTTKLVRHSDRKPLAHYSVRYKIVDGGADAVFLPSHTKEYTAVSDLSGLAQVPIMETAPILGSTKISMEVIRPPDPTAPAGTGVIIARGETNVDWLAAAVNLTHTGPQLALLGGEVTYESVVSNQGKINSQEITLASKVPDGLEFVRSDPPPGRVEGAVETRTLIWALPPLPAGAAHSPIRATYKTKKLGPVNDCMTLTTAEGMRDEKCVQTIVGTRALKVALKAQPTAVVGERIIFDLVIDNPGTGPLNNVVVTANYTSGLQYDNMPFAPLTLRPIAELPGQQTYRDALELFARQPGPQTVKIMATAGGLSDQAVATVIVVQPKISLTMDGEPNVKFVGRPATWKLTVSNPGGGVLNNVTVRDRLPPELEFTKADQGGEFKNGDVVWNVPQLQPGEKRVLNLTTLNKSPAKGLIHAATASAGPDLKDDAQVTLDINRTPGSPKLEVKDLGDPVTVGKNVIYLIRVTNTGQEPLNGVEVKAVVPNELKIISVQPPEGVTETRTGQTIDFSPKNFVEQDRPLEYRIEAQGLRPGDVRFRVELRTRGKEPIVEEESTTVSEAAAAPMK